MPSSSIALYLHALPTEMNLHGAEGGLRLKKTNIHETKTQKTWRFYLNVNNTNSKRTGFNIF
jgi:hypothetical protein